jgi:hypothetical protein
MMPPKPEPAVRTDYHQDGFGEDAFTEAQLIAYGRQCAEPVAWRYHAVSPWKDKDGMCKVSDKWTLISAPDQRDAHSALCGMEAEPLYTHPPVHQPLSESEIISLAYDCNALPEVITDKTMVAFVRAIEKAVREKL